MIKSFHVLDVWQDADLEVDPPILKRYLSKFPVKRRSFVISREYISKVIEICVAMSSFVDSLS